MAAVELLAHACCWAKLLQVASGLAVDNEPDEAAVQCAAEAFRAAGQTETARELHSKLGDHKVGQRSLAPQTQNLHAIPRKLHAGHSRAAAKDLGSCVHYIRTCCMLI